MRPDAIVGSSLTAVLRVAGLSARAPTAGPDPKDVPAAVAWSLPLLHSSAETSFAKRQCASCQHQGLGLIAATVARERGFPIDDGWGKPSVAARIERR